MCKCANVQMCKWDNEKIGKWDNEKIGNTIKRLIWIKNKKYA
jgi:hypothetical protein